VSEIAPSEETNEQPQAPKAETPKDPTFSKQFAQLARQERALRAKVQQQEQAIRAREEAIKAKEAELFSKDQQYQGYISKDQIKQNALQVLLESGVDPNELLQQVIGQPAVDPRIEVQLRQMQAKIQEFEKKEEAQRKTQLETQEQQYKTAVQQIQADVKSLVNQDPSFEMIKTTNSVRDVVDLIERHYKETGEILSNEEADQQVEEYLVEQAIRLAKANKIQSRLKPVATAKPQVQHQAPNKQSPPMKTLTNAVSSTRQLSARERAILAFKGEKIS
jgi:hypothetical protein